MGQDTLPPLPPEKQMINNALVHEAHKLHGMDTHDKSTGHALDDGNKACAYSVNKVFEQALGRRFGGDGVESIETAFKKGGANAIRPSEARPGDVVVRYDNGTPSGAHIGIVVENGRVLSNASSEASFTRDQTMKEFQDTHGGLGVRVYRVEPKAVDLDHVRLHAEHIQANGDKSPLGPGNTPPPDLKKQYLPQPDQPHHDAPPHAAGPSSSPTPRPSGAPERPLDPGKEAPDIPAPMARRDGFVQSGTVTDIKEGIVYQSVGRGKVEQYAVADFNGKPPEIGKSATIAYNDGQATARERTNEVALAHGR